MRGKKNPPLEIVPVPEGAPVTFDTMAQAYLQDYQLQRYRTLTTARARVEHLRGFFGGWGVEAINPDSVRNYQMHRRQHGSEAATVNRETSALSRMFQLAIRRGQLERMPLFPKRLEENPPREGFLEHDEYLNVRARRSKTKTGRVVPISAPLLHVLKRRQRRRRPGSPRVFHRDGVPVRAWRTALRDACRKAKVPHRLLHDCRRTAARNLIRSGVPERVAMLLTGHKTRAVFDRYNIVNEQELLTAGERLAAYVARTGSGPIQLYDLSRHREKASRWCRGSAGTP
jgi:site-specific recombinase XerD